MTIDTQILLLILAGTLAGLAIGLQIDNFRDTPWVIRRLYRYWRYHERPRSNDYPPSIRAYFKPRGE